MKGRGVTGMERMLVEGWVIKVHKTVSITSSRKVCCWVGPSRQCWPPVRGCVSQVIGSFLTACTAGGQQTGRGGKIQNINDLV